MARRTIARRLKQGCEGVLTRVDQCDEGWDSETHRLESLDEYEMEFQIAPFRAGNILGERRASRQLGNPVILVISTMFISTRVAQSSGVIRYMVD